MSSIGELTPNSQSQKGADGSRVDMRTEGDGTPPSGRQSEGIAVPPSGDVSMEEATGAGQDEVEDQAMQF